MPTLTPPEWPEAIRHAVRHRWLESGVHLFHRGDDVFGIFAVLDGRMRLIRQTSEGVTVTLHVATAGATFAEAALFSEVYHCDAVADIRSRLAILPKSAILAAFASSPETALAFMSGLARQVHALRTQLELRNVRGARERVLQYLRLKPPAQDAAVLVERPLKDIATEIGLTHEAFYRALAALEASGAITRSGRTITLTTAARDQRSQARQP